jgi:cobalt-zinc-cadmium efflux system outer membrane protein
MSQQEFQTACSLFFCRGLARWKWLFGRGRASLSRQTFSERMRGLSCGLGGLVFAFLRISLALAGTPADTAAIPRKLTLVEAERLLLERNLAVVAARYQVEASRAGRLIASYKPNPVLTVGAEQIPFYSPLHDLPRFFSTNSDAGANPVYTFRIDKITERGGKRELRTAQADFQLKASEAQMLDAVRTQLFQLRQAFASAMLARENLRLAEGTQQQYDHTERLTEVKVTNGDLPGVELYRVRAGRLQYEQTVLQARTSYVQAASDILNLLGARVEQVTPPGAMAQLSGGEARIGTRVENVSQISGGQQPSESLRSAPLEIVGTFDDGPVLQNLAELREIALAERPDVIAARNTLEAAGRGSLLAQAQRKRDLDIAYEYQRVGDDHTAGVTVQIPLLVYNNYQAAITQANAQRRAAEALLHQVELQAVTDVEKAYQAYQSSRRVLDLYNSENLIQVEKLRNISSYSYNEGAVSLFELLDAQRTYNQALATYNQARTDYQISLWQLEQAIGRPLR